MLLNLALCKNRAMFSHSEARDAQMYSTTKQEPCFFWKKRKKKPKPRHSFGIKEKRAMLPELTPPLL